MLSTDLRNLARALRLSADRGRVTMAHIDIAVTALDVFAEQASALEERPVPSFQRGDLPDGVVDLQRVRAARQAQAWLRSHSGPGGAA
jgi:hypothetical protein